MVSQVIGKLHQMEVYARKDLSGSERCELLQITKNKSVEELALTAFPDEGERKDFLEGVSNLSDPKIWIWEGGSATGKTTMLQALCREHENQILCPYGPIKNPDQIENVIFVNYVRELRRFKDLYPDYLQFANAHMIEKTMVVVHNGKLPNAIEYAKEFADQWRKELGDKGDEPVAPNVQITYFSTVFTWFKPPQIASTDVISE